MSDISVLDDRARIALAVKARVTNAKNPSRALVAAYVDARVVAQILDDAFGKVGWSFTHTPPQRVRGEDERVIGWWCQGTLKVGQIERSDVGSNDADNLDNGIKGAVSDAFKRAAVSFGVGRCLYEIDMASVDLTHTKGRLYEDSKEYADIIKGFKRAILGEEQVPPKVSPSPEPESSPAAETTTDEIAAAFDAEVEKMDPEEGKELDAAIDAPGKKLDDVQRQRIGKRRYAALKSLADSLDASWEDVIAAMKALGIQKQGDLCGPDENDTAMFDQMRAEINRIAGVEA